MTIELRDESPEEIAEPASELLRTAWRPPALFYSHAYLHWQLTFPSRQGAIAVGAYVGRALCGFVALTPRAVRLGDARLNVFVISFGAVRADERGQGLSSRIYSRALERVRAAGAAVIGFVAPNSRSVPAFERAIREVGLRHRVLEPCRTFAGFRDAARASPLKATPAAADAFRQAVPHCGDDVIVLDDDERQLAHYANDPRGREIVAVKSSDGVCGVAMVVCGEFCNTSSIDRALLLDSVHHGPGSPEPDELRGVLDHAAAKWNGRLTSNVVTAPSAATVPPAVLRGAGLRATSGVFRPYVVDASPDAPLLRAARTAIEVV